MRNSCHLFGRHCHSCNVKERPLQPIMGPEGSPLHAGRVQRLHLVSCGTDVITGSLDMCKICTEAIDCVALWTWTSVGNKRKTWFCWHVGTHHENVAHVCQNSQKAAFTLGTRACGARVDIPSGPKTNPLNLDKAWRPRINTMNDSLSPIDPMISQLKTRGFPKSALPPLNLFCSICMCVCLDANTVFTSKDA